MTAMNGTLLCGRNTPIFQRCYSWGKCLVNKEKALKIGIPTPQKSSVLQIFFKTVSKAPKPFLSEYLLSS